MNTFRTWISYLAVITAVIGVSNGVAHAATTSGKVTFVGTVTEEAAAGGFSARMRIRVNGTCDTDLVAKDRWLVIRSGRTDGLLSHNGINMRNAYSTLMAAMLSGKSVQIDLIPNCSTTNVIFVDLWAAQIGMF